MFVCVCLANKTRLLRDFEVRGIPYLVIEVSAMKSEKKRGLLQHIYSFREMTVLIVVSSGQSRMVPRAERQCFCTRRFT